MRPLWIGLALVALQACGAPGGPIADASVNDLGTPSGCSVRLEPSGAVVLRPSQRVNLRAIASPPAPGRELRFGLLGGALDGSLGDTRAVTDASGTAAVSLIAPSSAASFRVRASLPCGAESYLDVSVGDQGFGAVAVTAAYRGSRQPEGISVALYRATQCDTLLGVVPDRLGMLPAAGGTVQFAGLPAGLDFVVRGVATGQGAAELASGCSGPLSVMAGQTVAAVIVFADAPLRGAGAYDLALSFDLTSEAAVSAPLWTAPVAAEVARAGGDGLLFGADIAAAVATAAPAGGAGAARAAFEAALADHLAAQVSAQLARRGIGVSAAFGQVANAAAGVVASARAAAVLSLDAPTGSDAGPGTDAAAGPTTDAEVSVGPSEGPIDQVQYTLDPGTPDVRSDDVSVVLDGVARGRFIPGLGTGVGVAMDGLPLPYARLASAALGALVARLGVASVAEYVALSVCPVVTAVFRPATGACDDGCISTACRATIVRLGALFDAAVSSAQSGHVAVDLRFGGTARALPGTRSIDQVAGSATGSFRDDATQTVTAVASLTSRGTR